MQPSPHRQCGGPACVRACKKLAAGYSRIAATPLSSLGMQLHPLPLMLQAYPPLTHASSPIPHHPGLIQQGTGTTAAVTSHRGTGSGLEGPRVAQVATCDVSA
eukprot:1162090-Pelagomonas_calceolata.AAC.19